MVAQKRIKRVRAEGLEPVKAKHWEKFPDLDIIDSDDEEWWYIQELDPPPSNGREIIEARAARQASN